MSEYGHSSHEHLGQAPLLRDALIETTFLPNRALDPAVERLLLADPDNPQLYNLKASVEEPLRAAMLSDSLRREHAMDLMVTNTHKLLIPTRSTVHTQEGGNVWSYVHTRYVHAAGERLRVQDRYIAALPHTHPVEVPPSPTDLLPLFYEDENIGAINAVWVITESGSWMAFRGPHTPEWSEEACQAKKNAWNNLLADRVRPYLLPSMSRPQVVNINFKAQTAFLRQAAAKYDLQVFAGMRASAELTRWYTSFLGS
jgi:hypothetical protein